MSRGNVPDVMSRTIAIDHTETEESALLSIWQDLLGHDVGPHDDFFLSGGQSLTATQVVSRVREQFHVDLPLHRIFEAPTIAATAEWLRANRDRQSSVPPLVRTVATDERVPLSFSQERMWLVQKLAPESVAYHIGGAVLVRGPFDVERFRHAVYAVIRRHESLRTCFPLVNGLPVQTVTERTCEFEYLDLARLPVAERFESARLSAVEMTERPFNLETGSLCRLLIARLDTNEHMVALGVHHIVCDVWSYGVIGREITALYMDRDAQLPELPVSYRDYAAWQRGWLDEATLAPQLAYWRERLADLPELELPTDFTRPPLYTHSGGVVQRVLPAELRARLERFSAEHHATPFMTTLAVFNALLAAYSGQLDIAVGVPIANRSVREAENLVGTFVNTVVHRTDLSGNPEFVQLLARVRADALEAFAHQDLPLDRIMRELQPARDPSRTPLFNVLFNVTNIPATGAEHIGLATEVIWLPRRSANFDLTLNVGLNALQSDLNLSYNSMLFTRSSAERILNQYFDMLQRVLAEPEIRLSDLQLASESERSKLLVEWNATARDFPPDARVTSLFAAAAQRDPGRTAVESPTGTFTYGELLEYSQRVTAALQQLGVKPGDRVAILMQRSREMVGALLGILGSGAAYVPLDPSFPDARVRFMLEDSDAVAIVTHRGLEKQFQASVPVLDLDRWTPPAPVAFVQPADRQPAYLIYTSGSTGRPKGVEVPHAAVANFLLGMQERPGLYASDTLLAVTTISFDIAVLELFLPLVVGARVVIASEDDVLNGRLLMRTFDNENITVMQATPATWKLLLAAGWQSAPGLRVLCGGEPLPRSLADSLLDRVSEVWNVYGPTETTVWSTVDRVERETPVLIGRPIANTTVYVLREDLQPVPIGVPGELYIGGAGVSNGYVNLPELTAAKFIDDPFRPGERIYRTGDLVRYRADGRLEHLGRLDFQVKVRGYRIEPGEIESALRAIDGIRDAAVIANDERLIAYIVGTHGNGSLPPAGDVRRTLAESLPQYMLPSILIPVPELPLTPNGKLDRRRLPPLATPPPSTARKRLPDNPAERIVAEIWTSLLEIDEIGISDNFFELGGHSLLAMQAVAALEQRTGVRLDPRALFFRTLAEVAEALRG